MGDGNRNHIDYTTAERMSFQIVPETCPAIERAFDKAKNYNSADWQEVLAKYGIEITPQMRGAIHEIVGKIVFNAFHGLDKVVKYQGTFVLRQALIEVMEDHLRLKGVEPEPSHFKGWLAWHGRSDADVSGRA